ncbi:hypothetical protein B0T25DRAFT_256149 [Lasiosphaeria hispida]|uniref:Uncharacterized protein n=1 Tax=Lasiosphaeria hispida TaxID=260671 RepID=A0AAJ0MCV7_9PEZI|nr:hypothetical protein B0T25DRAFT_256149 [Lasiosphaeria hispida]
MLGSLAPPVPLLHSSRDPPSLLHGSLSVLAAPGGPMHAQRGVAWERSSAGCPAQARVLGVCRGKLEHAGQKRRALVAGRGLGTRCGWTVGQGMFMNETALRDLWGCGTAMRNHVENFACPASLALLASLPDFRTFLAVADLFACMPARSRLDLPR